MKICKDLRNKKDVKNPSEQAYFGSHSNEKNEVFENVDADDEHSKPHEFSPILTDPIHKKVEPINDDDLNLGHGDAVVN